MPAYLPFGDISKEVGFPLLAIIWSLVTTLVPFESETETKSTIEEVPFYLRTAKLLSLVYFKSTTLEPKIRSFYLIHCLLLFCLCIYTVFVPSYKTDTSLPFWPNSTFFLVFMYAAGISISLTNWPVAISYTKTFEAVVLLDS